MSTDLIKAVLGEDYVPTRTAADCRTAKPGQWASDGDVPIAYYTPLAQMMFGTGATQDQLLSILINIYGTGITPEDKGIHIISLPFESVYKPEGWRSNEDGAEWSLLKIMSQVGESIEPNSPEAILATQLDLRVRFNLDFFARKVRKKNGDTAITTTGLDPKGDLSIDQNQAVRCRFVGFIDNESAIAKASFYSLEYTRLYV